MGRPKNRRGLKLAPGIWKDAYGQSVIVTVARRQHEERFPPNLPLAELHLRQSEMRAYWQRCAQDDAAAQTPRPARGTLAGDVAHYLETREGRPGYKADRSHLAAWCAAHGTRPRHLLTPHVAAAQISTWLAAGKAPKTIKHRVRVAKELWHHLDGAHRRTPFDDLQLPRVPKTLPAPVDDAVIQSVADSLKAGLRITKRHGPQRTVAAVQVPAPKATYARFLVRALSGQRPSQIARALPAHIDRVNRIWWVTAGKGGNPIPFPLSDELDLAWAYFAQVDAWGSFDCRSFSKTLKRHGWPATVQPYRLRHAFAIGQLLAGIDLGDLQGLLGHASPATTRIYAPILLSRLKSAVERRPLRLVQPA